VVLRALIRLHGPFNQAAGRGEGRRKEGGMDSTRRKSVTQGGCWKEAGAKGAKDAAPPTLRASSSTLSLVPAQQRGSACTAVPAGAD
jgi:hypothetical protein